MKIKVIKQYMSKFKNYSFLHPVYVLLFVFYRHVDNKIQNYENSKNSRDSNMLYAWNLGKNMARTRTRQVRLTVYEDDPSKWPRYLHLCVVQVTHSQDTN